MTEVVATRTAPKTGVYEHYDTLEQHAAWLGRSPRTLMRWTDTPDGVPFTTDCAGRRLFKPAWTLAWLEARKTHRNPRRGRRAA